MAIRELRVVDREEKGMIGISLNARACLAAPLAGDICERQDFYGLDLGGWRSGPGETFVEIGEGRGVEGLGGGFVEEEVVGEFQESGPVFGGLGMGAGAEVEGDVLGDAEEAKNFLGGEVGAEVAL